MQRPKLITDGEIINADSRQKADLLIENGVITKIGTGLTVAEGTEVINARGKYIFPGFIDPHVHIHLPFMGTCTKDTYDSASRAGCCSLNSRTASLCMPFTCRKTIKIKQYSN